MARSGREHRDRDQQRKFQRNQKWNNRTSLDLHERREQRPQQQPRPTRRFRAA